MIDISKCFEKVELNNNRFKLLLNRSGVDVKSCKIIESPQTRFQKTVHEVKLSDTEHQIRGQCNLMVFSVTQFLSHQRVFFGIDMIDVDSEAFVNYVRSDFVTD
jgi:hypothetical protein